MADRLTQLQDCYDQLATQFYASIRYISLHHNASPLDPPPLPTSSSPLDNQPNINNTAPALTNHQAPTPQPTQSQSQDPSPTTQSTTQPPTTTSQPPDRHQQPEVSSLPPEQRPDSPTTFASAQRELAHDLILKAEQIQYIISILPGVENSKVRQEERIRELDGELREAFTERERMEEKRRGMLDVVEGVIGAVRR